MLSDYDDVARRASSGESVTIDISHLNSQREIDNERWKLNDVLLKQTVPLVIYTRVDRFTGRPYFLVERFK